jgi:dTDP-4-dehydrorhamnose reductase
MTKTIVVGNGFVASHLKYNIVRDRLYASETQIESFIDSHKPDIIINCVGRCGAPNVDYCESNKEETLIANVTIPTLLATAAYKHNIRLIHISSGCIFYGESPNKEVVTTSGGLIVDDAPTRDIGWKEGDFANPKSYYSKSKYSCDLVIGSLSNVASLRIRMPVSSKSSPRNLINKLLNYESVLDVKNSMTFMPDLINVVDWFVNNDKNGLWHVTNPDPLSPADVMREYQKYDTNHKFISINENELAKLTVATRSNCYLNTDKLNKEGVTLTPSKDALQLIMKKFIENKGTQL